jgi:hypothetical protein
MIGILTTHGCVTESIHSSRELYGLRDDRVLQFSNYTFDLSIWVCLFQLFCNRKVIRGLPRIGVER